MRLGRMRPPAYAFQTHPGGIYRRRDELSDIRRDRDTLEPLDLVLRVVRVLRQFLQRAHGLDIAGGRGARRDQRPRASPPRDHPQLAEHTQGIADRVPAHIEPRT
ncbi:MAG: hypothetical protein ABS35_12685 [Kaistia sp. SCN 65-12]|nr:MAG: hypothetical protein ABS35_12685 [Kaistia sp. SCN 65-12]